jgi:NADH dehydrogenase
MKIAITGGTGFIGHHLAHTLVDGGHEVVLIARGFDERDTSIRQLHRARFVPIDVTDKEKLVSAFAGCGAVAHCAGINREIGSQTYQRIHVEGTRHVVNAAKRAGVQKIVMLSFLRARPHSGSLYHDSKWMAEEIVRSSGLDYTVIKAGMVYGKGDHMLDHISHSLHTLPLFASVGIKEKPIRPLAIEDLLRVLRAALTEGRLSRHTVAVTGPEEMMLSEAVRRVAQVLNRRVFILPAPVFLQYVFAWCFEYIMKIPLISLAQVRMLAEGIVEPSGVSHALPDDLRPKISFTGDQIRRHLPLPKAFGPEDLRAAF